MRIIFAFLLLANIGALMWGTWYREASLGQQKHARPDINAASLRRLDEPGVELDRRTQPTAAPLSRATPEVISQCYRLGPFGSVAERAALMKRLEQLGVRYRELDIDGREEAGTRLYLTGFTSQKRAEAKRKQLLRMGITDHAVVQEGDKKFSVSLGVFSQAVSTQRRLRELRDKGIKPKVQTLYRKKPQQWLETVPIDATLQARIEPMPSGGAMTAISCGPSKTASDPGK